jgi:hypothetical protein
VALDQTPSTSPPESTAIPAIDNEFPTYRAISPTAVLSLVLGVGSVFCYADLWFLLMVAASVALGLYSLKKIRELPEVLTGAGLARVGIGIALLFGLTSVTRVLTEGISINLDAGKFARFYMGVIKDQPVKMALWYQQSLAYRQEKDADAMVDEMKKAKSPSSGDVYQTNAAPILAIKERLDGGKGEMSYAGIETRAVDGLTVYANALIKLDLKGTKEHPETEMYALLHLIKGMDEWIVKEVTFPYTPKSAVATVEKPHDDGHGH